MSAQRWVLVSSWWNLSLASGSSITLNRHSIPCVEQCSSPAYTQKGDKSAEAAVLLCCPPSTRHRSGVTPKTGFLHSTSHNSRPATLDLPLDYPDTN